MASRQVLSGAFAVMATVLSCAGIAAADVTIGADVNGPFNGIGACSGGGNPANRPCTIISTLLPGRPASSPCAGTVTRFRLNGVPTANTYRLRVVNDNDNGTYTGTATSSPAVSIGSEGVNEYPTSLPIGAGDYIGIDFQDSTASGLRWFFGPGISQHYFYAFPPDGSPDSPTGTESSYYLFNADVSCAGEGGGGGGGGPISPAPGPPSNQFRYVNLKGKRLTLELASAGAVTVANSLIPKKAKGKPKLLKRSTASGGPGLVTVPLKLTNAAKQALREKGRVKASAVISFTPTGGSTAILAKKLTVKSGKAPAK